MVLKNAALLLLCIGFLAISVNAIAQVSVNVACTQPLGWMADGWGSCKFTFKNDGKALVEVVKWIAYWQINNEHYGESLGGDINLNLTPGQEATQYGIGNLPVDIVEKSKPGNPVLSGTVTIRFENSSEQEIPFSIDIPEAILREKTKVILSEHVGIELIESRFENLKDQKQMLRWMDQCYTAMQELTGQVIYDGKPLIIKESPAHPWWAYADNPIVLNTECVPDVMDDYNQGIISFGWVHEMGHVFDGDLREWFDWNISAVEWQANWKLAYAYETIPDRSFKTRWDKNKNNSYNPAVKGQLLEGKQFIDSYFLFFGDPYLADTTRRWESMSSDDIHSFCQRLVRLYGWEPFKQWYRTYARFDKLGLKKPETPEGKIQLMAAILTHEIGIDLVPIFQRWRMPVTQEDIDTMNKTYPISESAAE